MLRRAYLGGVAALAAFYYFFFGAGPTPSEYVDDLEWWRPWGTALHWPPLMGLAEMARAGFPRAWLPLLLGCAPPLLLGALGWRLMKGVLERAWLVFLVFLMCVFVYYGLRAEQVWRFLEWRFAAVSASFCAIITAFLFAPRLFEGALHASRALAALLAAIAVAGIFLLSTEVTGTNSAMQFNISVWPVITLFGFLLFGASIAVLHASLGAAAWLRGRVPRWPGALLGVAAAAIVAAIAGRFVFDAPGGRFVLVVLALLLAAAGAAVAAFRGRREPENASYHGAVRFGVGAALLLVILGSAQIAGALQRRARDVTALKVLDALEAYKKDNATYPDKLDALVPKYLDEIPRPQIGIIRDEDDRFTYSNYGDSYALEFASVLWVQCQYSPPYEFAGADPNEPEELPDVPTKEGRETPDVAANKEPSADDLQLKATLAQHGLSGSWSCPKEPPKLW
ncbi:MAG TPA: hypothetical protein VMR31_17035 [Myxococcota bacterium]|nr:hypothetical protein [Myxococcota bacterium]